MKYKSQKHYRCSSFL